jgi:hypothetical protein
MKNSRKRAAAVDDKSKHDCLRNAVLALSQGQSQGLARGHSPEKERPLPPSTLTALDKPI